MTGEKNNKTKKQTKKKTRKRLLGPLDDKVYDVILCKEKQKCRTSEREIPTWPFYHPGDFNPPPTDSSIILWTTTYLNLTVSSSWGPLPRPPSPLDSSIFLGTTTLLYLIVLFSWWPVHARCAHHILFLWFLVLGFSLVWRYVIPSETSWSWAYYLNDRHTKLIAQVIQDWYLSV